MSRPLVVDLFCGLGGAAVGYHRAGFDVVGCDQLAQPDYPFPMYEADALAVLAMMIGGHLPSGRPIAAWHASPPCQAAAAPTLGTNAARNAAVGLEHPQLIPEVRAGLERTGLPYVIENTPMAVRVAGLRPDVTLCGLSFGLRVFRHRVFELGNWSATAPEHVSHRGHRVSGWRHGVWSDGDMLAVYGRRTTPGGQGGGKATVDQCREGLGIDWSRNRDQLVEAIPPAYTEHLGHQLLAQLNRMAA